ncbi:helix-turn-helix domain-containing protein [Streptomyces sp. EN23]|uniref:response regulator transcription factor n=1 Tax=Streptomyces sp. EN23 TaxID=212774 RepID=UPI00114CFA79|nr:response regulator transcription factor [Streptomyces sp. EN23]
MGSSGGLSVPGRGRENVLGIPETAPTSEAYLTEVDRCLYECVLESGHAEASELATRLGISRKEAESSVRRLLALRLLNAKPGSKNRVSAVSPSSAVALVATPIENGLRRRMEEVERFRHELLGLLPLFEHCQTGGAQPLQALPELGDVLATIEQLAAECQEEVLTAQPGGRRNVEELTEAIERDEGMLRRGIRMRTLYQHPARYHQATVAYTERLTGLGGEVRTTSANLMRVIIFDRKAALVSLAGHDQGAMVIRDRSVVDFAVQAFEHIWLKSDLFPVGHDSGQIRTVSEDMDHALVRLLVSGESDHAVARRLGISIRTLQRRLVRISKELGANSRLQAGYLIHRSGLLEKGQRPDGAKHAPVNP